MQNLLHETDEEFTIINVITIIHVDATVFILNGVAVIGIDERPSLMDIGVEGVGVYAGVR